MSQEQDDTIETVAAIQLPATARGDSEGSPPSGRAGKQTRQRLVRAARQPACRRAAAAPPGALAPRQRLSAT